jgi:hypothetical protein
MDHFCTRVWTMADHLVNRFGRVGSSSPQGTGRQEVSEYDWCVWEASQGLASYCTMTARTRSRFANRTHPLGTPKSDDVSAVGMGSSRCVLTLHPAARSDLQHRNQRCSYERQIL